MGAWATQTELGKAAGLTARQVGDRLRDAGLKGPGGPTAAAVEAGMTREARTRSGEMFHVWLKEKALPAIMGDAVPDAQPGRDRSGFEHVYATDGSSLGNPGPTGWAFVNERTRQTGSGGLPHGTNNIGEVTAAIMALRHAGPDGDVLIRSDSRYVVDMASKWLPGWKRKGWVKADGKPVQNVDLVRALDAEITSRTGRTVFEWVRGHAGDEFNEIVDQLAVAAAARSR